MSTINPFPLNITLKVNSPMLLAYLAQYGEDKFASAEDFNKIFQALDYLHENLDSIGNDFNPSEHDLEEFLNEGADPFAHQSEITGPQNFQSVTDGSGNNETTNSVKVGGFEIKDKLAFIISSLTALRNINWQDKDGTVALLSDLTAIQEGIAWKQPAELLLQYADVVQNAGLPKIPGLTLQGHTLSVGSRVVVVDYNIPYQNGIFRVGSGPIIGTGEYQLSRVADANTSAELNNAVIGITNGIFAGKTYRQTTVNPIINTSPISFVEFGNSTVANATNVLAGIAKLYNAIGNETDGGITPKAVKDGLELKQDNLTDVNFGAFSNGLTAKTTIVDADLVTITDSADSNKSKKVTWLNVWTNYLLPKVNTVLASFKTTNFLDFTSSGQGQLNSKANDSAVVHNTGGETIAGAKTFTSTIAAQNGISSNSVGMINSTTANNSQISPLVAGMKITRNIADANPANIVDLLHASSTGNIEEWKWQSVLKAFVDRLGNITANSFITPTGDVQTQLNSKPRIIVSDGQTTTSSLVATEQKLKSYLIPANTIPDSSILALKTRMYKDSGGGAAIYLRVYLNTSDTLVGATQIAVVLFNSPIVQDIPLERTISIIGANLSILNNNYNATSDSTVANVTPSIIPFDRTANQYLIVSGQTANYLIPLYLKYVSLIKL